MATTTSTSARVCVLVIGGSLVGLGVPLTGRAVGVAVDPSTSSTPDTAYVADPGADTVSILGQPGTPGTPNVSPGPGSATVSWPVASGGQLPVTGYTFTVTAANTAGPGADGGIFSFGSAGFSGSMGVEHLNAPMVGVAAAPTGHGYWEVAADGEIFAFGQVPFSGSMGGEPLNAPVAGMAA